MCTRELDCVIKRQIVYCLLYILCFTVFSSDQRQQQLFLQKFLAARRLCEPAPERVLDVCDDQGGDDGVVRLQRPPAARRGTGLGDRPLSHGPRRRRWHWPKVCSHFFVSDKLRKHGSHADALPSCTTPHIFYKKQFTRNMVCKERPQN